MQIFTIFAALLAVTTALRHFHRQVHDDRLTFCEDVKDFTYEECHTEYDLCTKDAGRSRDECISLIKEQGEWMANCVSEIQEEGDVSHCDYIAWDLARGGYFTELFGTDL